VYEVSDRITVLRNGSFVGCRETRELPQIELVKMMLGRELETNALQRAGRTLLSENRSPRSGFGKKGSSHRLIWRSVPVKLSAWPACWAPGAPKPPR
jgi:ABC-type sugar transport system ATPase subunit